MSASTGTGRRLKHRPSVTFKEEPEYRAVSRYPREKMEQGEAEGNFSTANPFQRSPSAAAAAEEREREREGKGGAKAVGKVSGSRLPWAESKALL